MSIRQWDNDQFEALITLAKNGRVEEAVDQLVATTGMNRPSAQRMLNMFSKKEVWQQLANQGKAEISNSAQIIKRGGEVEASYSDHDGQKIEVTPDSPLWKDFKEQMGENGLITQFESEYGSQRNDPVSQEYIESPNNTSNTDKLFLKENGFKKLKTTFLILLILLLLLFLLGIF